MRTAEEKTIEGTAYRVLPVAAGIGQKILLRAAKVGAPTVMTLLASPKSAKGAWMAAIPSVMRLVELLSEEDVEYITKEFARETQCGSGGKMRPLGDCYDEHFRGAYPALLQWLRFAWEVNFGPLWTWAAAQLPRAPDADEVPEKA